MLVFVDDSGDCGMKFDKGSSRHLVLAACVFKSNADVEDTWRQVDASRFLSAGPLARQVFKNEYKYARTSIPHKDRFFKHIESAKFAVRAIIVDKQRIYSPALRAHPNDMKGYMLMQLLTHTYGQVHDAKLVIDGQDNRTFGVSDRDYFLKTVNGRVPGTLTGVEFADSRKNEIIQVADMIAGSLRKARESDVDARRHYDTYKRRLWQPEGSYWVFK